jgi:hypothetical protein
MFKTITAAYVNKRVSLSIPVYGRRCFIRIDDSPKIEMIPEQVTGALNGVRWYFKCPETGKRCRKLVWKDNSYVHMATIKNYYRKIKPEWYSEMPINKILVTKQKQIDAEKSLEKKWYKKTHKGKPTKRYQKCLRHIEAGSKYTMTGIISGHYG